MSSIKSICIIDDDPIFVFGFKKIVSRIAKSDQLSLIHYKNGLEALENLISQIEKKILLPDLIFLDLNMPIMDGWQFLDEFVKLKSKTISIYVVSSSINPLDVKKAISYNFVLNYIEKPISLEKMNDLIILKNEY